MLNANQNKTKNNALPLSIFLGVLIVARLSCVALSNVPFMSVGFIFLYAALFIVLFLLTASKIEKIEACALGALLLYLFEVIFSTVIAKKGLFETQAFNAYILTILFFLYLFTKRIPDKYQKLFTIIILFGYIFTFIYSIVKLAQDPMLSRVAATGRYDDATVDSLGAIGGFDAVYGGLLVFVIMLYLCGIVKNKWLKAFFVLSCVCCAVFIFMATYATAIVLLVVALALMILRRSRLSAFLLILALLVCYFFRANIGDYIMSWSKTVNYSDIFQEKMYQIGYMIKFGESAGTLAGEEGRWARMGWSWDTFLQHPLFGGFTVDNAKIGSHSEVFDLLGRFGLYGFVSLFVFFVYLFRDIAKNLSTKTGKNMLFVCIILYLLISILDPSLYTQQVLPIFMLLPFVEKWKKKEVAV